MLKKKSWAIYCAVVFSFAFIGLAHAQDFDPQLLQSAPVIPVFSGTQTVSNAMLIDGSAHYHGRIFLVAPRHVIEQFSDLSICLFPDIWQEHPSCEKIKLQERWYFHPEETQKKTKKNIKSMGIAVSVFDRGEDFSQRYIQPLFVFSYLTDLESLSGSPEVELVFSTQTGTVHHQTVQIDLHGPQLEVGITPQLHYKEVRRVRGSFSADAASVFNGATLLEGERWRMAGTENFTAKDWQVQTVYGMVLEDVPQKNSLRRTPLLYIANAQTILETLAYAYRKNPRARKPW